MEIMILLLVLSVFMSEPCQRVNAETTTFKSHTYNIHQGFRHNGISIQETLTVDSIYDCTLECSKRDTSCEYANYDVTSNLCSILDDSLQPPLSYSVNIIAISRLGVPSNCFDIKNNGLSHGSDIYTIHVPSINDPDNSTKMEVYCDMETEGGGWLVFQRRKDGSEDFYRDWNDYANGFGDKRNEFWLGNEDLHQILNSNGNQYELRFDLGAFDGSTRYAKYSTFNIASSVDNYRLTVGGYTGDAVDGMARQNGQQFTTYDRDNDVKATTNCAVQYKGGWWFESCYDANLNGLYLNGDIDSEGIRWNYWILNSLKFTEIKIRPRLI